MDGPNQVQKFLGSGDFGFAEQREVDAAVIVQKHWRRNQAKRRFEGMLDEVRRVTGAQAPDSAVRFWRIEFVH